MPIDLSSFFRNDRYSPINNTDQTQNVQSTGSVQQTADSTQTTAGDAAKVLQNMLAGDTFLGYVKDMDENNVLLQLGNGSLVSARLSEQTNIQLGQNVTFLIENNTEENVTLKAMTGEMQENVLIGKALDAANLSFSDSNIAVVKELLANQMPIDAEMIGNLVKNSLKFPEASLNTMANLMKLDIPVTQENITQYEAYQNFEHSILNEVNQLPSQLNQNLSQLIMQGNLSDGTELLQQVIQNLYQDPTVQGSDSAAQQNGQEQAVQSMNAQELLGRQGMENLKQMISDLLPQQSEQLNQMLEQSDTSVKDLLQQISEQLHNLAAEGNTPNDEQLAQMRQSGIHNLLNSKEFQSLMKQSFDETLKMTPSNVAKEDAISNFYKRVRGSMENIADEMNKKLPDSQLAKNVNDVRNNIDFMNDLNRNMTYVQMPLKFSESETNGELYVFTNKKSLKDHSDQVSALLHLDLENLGPTDIYVKLSGQNVTTNFCLESEAMLDFVNEHIDELNDRLESLGYHTHFEMKVTDPEQQSGSPVREMLPKEQPTGKMTQYLFDTKA